MTRYATQTVDSAMRRRLNTTQTAVIEITPAHDRRNGHAVRLSCSGSSYMMDRLTGATVFHR
jgi:hypothetical protein